MLTSTSTGTAAAGAGAAVNSTRAVVAEGSTGSSNSNPADTLNVSIIKSAMHMADNAATNRNGQLKKSIT
jgi:hypothetical protein